MHWKCTDQRGGSLSLRMPEIYFWGNPMFGILTPGSTHVFQSILDLEFFFGKKGLPFLHEEVDDIPCFSLTLLVERLH